MKKLTLAVLTAGITTTLGAVLPLPASGGAVPECANADLTASYRGGDAAMSHTYGRIVLTNTSDHACRTGGYGGLSYVGGGDGTQVGAAADREPATVRTYVLQPGQRVHSRVAETSFAPYPKAKCRPRHVDGLPGLRARRHRVPVRAAPDDRLCEPAGAPAVAPAVPTLIGRRTDPAGTLGG